MAGRLKIRVVTRAQGDIAATLGISSLGMTPQKSGRIALPKKASAEEAFQITLLHCLRHIARNGPAVSFARDPEGVHQIRVGLRRLRAALASFGPAFRTPSLESINARAREFARGFGVARELDVFALEMLPPIEDAAKAEDGFLALRIAIEERRNHAWNECASLAQSDAFTTFILDLARQVEARSWREHASATQIEEFERPVKKLAKEMLGKRMKKACRGAKRLKHLDEEGRHELRIALKKLRYCSEFYASLFARKPTSSFLRHLSKLQDCFGAMNDIASSNALLHRFAEDTPVPNIGGLAKATAFATGWLAANSEPLWKKTRKQWKRFHRAEPFWR